MGFFDKVKDKAKGHIEKVKENASKQDILDLVTEARDTIVSGMGSDEAKNKAMLHVAKGLGQMAMGTYKGGSRQLDDIPKDPYDVQMAEETKDELNAMLVDRLNPRKFIYGDPETAHAMGMEIVECMNFIGLVQDKTLLPRIHEVLDKNEVKYNADALDSEINKFIRDRDTTQMLSIRHQVDKYIFVDRKTKEEILSIFGDLKYSQQKHYKYECEYCGQKFEKVPETSSAKYHCQRHPHGPFNGPHKIHSIGAEKLWV